MRHDVLRRLHGVDERSRGEVLHRLCGASRRRGDYDRRRVGARRRTSSDSKGIWRLLWSPMRLLHTWLNAFCASALERQFKSDPEGDSQSDRGKYLPVHWLSEYFESDRNRRGENEERHPWRLSLAETSTQRVPQYSSTALY